VNFAIAGEPLTSLSKEKFKLRLAIECIGIINEE
jgi:hypothetical protein